MTVRQPDRKKLSDSGGAALIADNFAVEATPARPCMDDIRATLPLHAHCLLKLGRYLDEMVRFTELADWRRANRRFLFAGRRCAHPARSAHR